MLVMRIWGCLHVLVLRYLLLLQLLLLTLPSEFAGVLGSCDAPVVDAVGADVLGMVVVAAAGVVLTD